MKKLLFLIATIAILGLIVSGCIAPLESIVPTSEKGNQKPELGTPTIERGVFVDYGYSSPPWYPPEEETDRYQWGPKVYWASTDLPVNVTVYTLGAPTGALAAVTPAFAEWERYTLTNIYGDVIEDFETAPLPSVEVRDGENTVSWREIDGPGRIIAVTYYWYWVNTKELLEVDIVFDKDETWLATDNPDVIPEPSDPEDPYPATGEFDVWNITTHELGHTLVLSDLRSPKDGALTMHAYTWTGDAVKRTLGSGDKLGIQAIYGE